MNMQRVMIGAGFFIVAFVVSPQTSLPASLLAFLVLGIIPGTNIALPAWAILLVYPALIGTVVYWLHNEAFFIGEPTPPPKATKVTVAKSRKTRAKKTAAAKRRARATV